jgi:hypothetical protein
MTEERRIAGLATAAAAGTRVGKVSALLDEAVLVACGGGDEIVACDLLEPRAPGTRPLAEGETVLVVIPEGNGGRGVVLGRVLRPTAAGTSADGLPEEILLEARKGLTLKVGEGSITLREDGKILLRGRDLVSHARRLNRIRGGTVSIN